MSVGLGLVDGEKRNCDIAGPDSDCARTYNVKDLRMCAVRSAYTHIAVEFARMMAMCVQNSSDAAHYYLVMVNLIRLASLLKTLE
jgi:hypothetical protein